MLRDLDRNQNLKHSGHEKDKAEKSSSDADPAGECVHVQAGMIHDTCPLSRLGVELFSCDIFSPEVPLQIFLAAAKRCDS